MYVIQTSMLSILSDFLLLITDSAPARRQIWTERGSEERVVKNSGSSRRKKENCTLLKPLIACEKQHGQAK